MYTNSLQFVYLLTGACMHLYCGCFSYSSNCGTFSSCQTVKTKEEKEVLEHFAGVVSGCVHLLRLAHYKSVTALSLSLSLPLPPSLPPTLPVHHDEHVHVQGDLH